MKEIFIDFELFKELFKGFILGLLAVLFFGLGIWAERKLNKKKNKK